ncbi:uncharacterized protein [Typha angustifolia]|uniref:uncharacterized protein n=1 Tax=Typha angustifolia TaxID=59011 RepID=UPI003C2D1571
MRALIASPFLLFYLISVLCSPPTTGGDTHILTPTRPLTDGETLVSAGGCFAIGFFSPVNSRKRYVGIWYHKVSIQTVVWVANRQTPLADPTGNLSITAGGDLVILDKNSTIVWSSDSSDLGLTSAVAQILDDGNFVVREATSNSTDAAGVAWQSFDHPTDTFLPGMKVGENLTSGLKIKYQSWASISDPAPGNYTFALDLHGDPQLFLFSLTGKIWRSGPWNGLRFSGTPYIYLTQLFYFTDISRYNKNRYEIFYRFDSNNSSAISRLRVDQSGVIQWLVWKEATKEWVIGWYKPKNSCDKISTCGPFALCDINDVDDSAICHCMQGFQPKSPDNWALREWSDGCVRETKLDCTNGADVFVRVGDVKLPDTSSSTVDMTLSLEQCKALCLKNCSCTGCATANISGSGSGCILWTSSLTDVREYYVDGQDLYLRLAAADLEPPSDSSRKRKFVPIVGALLLALLICYAWKRKKKHKKKLEEVEEFDLPLYDLNVIQAATNNFSVENKLGQGGFGPVYKGQLGEGEEIAVKRLSKASGQGIDEFKNEVTLIAKLQHRNLVRLLGCCIQGEERILVYEYMPNRSLDVILFDISKALPLDWHTRYNIIFGIARGLLYLHHDSRFKIIHRDLKASNILLDKDMNPKISDFGMARIFGEEETEVNTNRIVGTYGYMSPEYAMYGIFSKKSDIFSFGVLVLEIISGKRNRAVYCSNSNHQENLLGHAWSLWEEGNAMQLLDESMGSSFPLDEALRCIQLGLLCVQEHPEDRPTTSSVVLVLGGENVCLPQPRQPGFVTKKGFSNFISSSSKLDAMSITVLESFIAMIGLSGPNFTRLASKKALGTMRALIAAPFLLCLIIPALCSLATGADTLIPNRPLTDGKTLISAGDSFALGFFSPVNSTNRYVGIWYHKKVTIQTVVWVANRQNPIADTTGSLSITAGGDLVIYDKNSTIIWFSNSSVQGLTGAVAQILDNGNFVVREAASNNTDAANVAWQSFDHPTDTFLPGMKIGENLTSGLKIKLQSWTSLSDPAPGNCILGLDLHGDPQLFLSSLMGHIWRGGPWNGIRFSGIPEMNTNSILAGFDFTNANNSVFNSFEEGKFSAIGRLTVLQSVFQFFVWSEENKAWVTNVYSPRDSCDNISTCGPYALCDINIDTVICGCMQGFQPKSLNDWALRDYSGGCVRKTKLDCTNGTDGFAMVSGVKLPDTSSSTVDVSLSLEECKALCLKNCSCTGYATANISGSGSGCILWTSNLTDLRKYTSNGQDLYLRLAAADLGSSSHNSHKKIIAGILVGSTVGALLLAMVVYCAWKKKGKNHKKKQVYSASKIDTTSFIRDPIDGREGAEEFDLPFFDLSIIEAATNNFSVDNKLGEGGFGPVYKGQLREGEYIAVKRLSKTSAQGCNEFKNEAVLIAKLQHRNLVRLLGCCIQREQRILVYEYLPNKSLDVLLFDKSKDPPLDWRTRYNIIFGIARGLLYLHQDSRFRIIHRDLKASNILLDKDMNPKISDFGTAKIFGEEDVEVNTSKVIGTYGYMSPEYVMDGIFSLKSDVFSFGVLVLEIISGKKNRTVYCSNSEHQENLLTHAWSLWKDGNGMQLLDESMRSAAPLDEALRCLKLGLLCVQEHPKDRPTMCSVVVMLNGEDSSLSHPRQPGFVTMRSPSVLNSSSIKQNAITITHLEGR